jgi:hypothetical protein
MLKALSRDELLDLIAFYEIDPPGDRRADLRAMSASIVALAPSDMPKALYPYYGESVEDMIEDEEQIEYMKQINEEDDFGGLDDAT